MSQKNISEHFADRIWNEKDINAINEYLDEKCVIHSSLGEFCGTESMKQVVQAWLVAFPHLVVTNMATFKEKDIEVVHWKAQGRHEGEFKGIKPTLKVISYSGVTLYRIRQNKIVEYWAYLDDVQSLIRLHTKD